MFFLSLIYMDDKKRILWTLSLGLGIYLYTDDVMISTAVITSLYLVSRKEN